LKGLVRARAFNQPELFLAMNDPLPKQKHCKQERLSRLTRQEEMKNNVKPNKEDDFNETPPRKDGNALLSF
jgi:hypothetical protein